MKTTLISFLITICHLYHAERLCDLSICATGKSDFTVDISHDDGVNWQPIMSTSTKVDIAMEMSITDIALVVLRFDVDDEHSTGGFTATVRLACPDGYDHCFYTDEDNTMFDVVNNDTVINTRNGQDRESSKSDSSETDTLDCMHPDAKPKWMSNGMSGDTVIFKVNLFGDIASSASCNGESQHLESPNSAKSWLEPPKLYYLIGGVGCLLLIGVSSYFLWPWCQNKGQKREEISECHSDSEHVVPTESQTQNHQSKEEQEGSYQSKEEEKQSHLSIKKFESQQCPKTPQSKEQKELKGDVFQRLEREVERTEHQIPTPIKTQEAPEKSTLDIDEITQRILGAAMEHVLEDERKRYIRKRPRKMSEKPELEEFEELKKTQIDRELDKIEAKIKRRKARLLEKQVLLLKKLANK